jgi:hypothetical protein
MLEASILICISLFALVINTEMVLYSAPTQHHFLLHPCSGVNTGWPWQAGFDAIFSNKLLELIGVTTILCFLTDKSKEEASYWRRDTKKRCEKIYAIDALVKN